MDHLCLVYRIPAFGMGEGAKHLHPSQMRDLFTLKQDDPQKRNTGVFLHIDSKRRPSEIGK